MFLKFLALHCTVYCIYYIVAMKIVRDKIKIVGEHPNSLDLGILALTLVYIYIYI